MGTHVYPFLCPECASTQAGIAQMVSTEYDPEDAWSDVLQRITCAECGFPIPAHLAERWDGISVEQARQEWREKYRDAIEEGEIEL